ncbi:MAG: hypothetical protein RSB71_03935 [Bacilli bacterium]
MKKICYSFFFFFVLTIGLFEIEAKTCTFTDPISKQSMTKTVDKCPIMIAVGSGGVENIFNTEAEITNFFIKNSTNKYTSYIETSNQIAQCYYEDKGDGYSHGTIYVSLINGQYTTKYIASNPKDSAEFSSFNKDGLIKDDGTYACYDAIYYTGSKTIQKSETYQYSIPNNSNSDKGYKIITNVKDKSFSTTNKVSDNQDNKVCSYTIPSHGKVTLNFDNANFNFDIDKYSVNLKPTLNDIKEANGGQCPNKLCYFCNNKPNSKQCDFSLNGQYCVDLDKGASADEIGKVTDIILGNTFSDYICQLKPDLEKLASNKGLSIKNPILNRNCTTKWCSSGDINKCNDELEYNVESEIREVFNYCNNFFSSYYKDKHVNTLSERMDECINFDKFYNQLTDDGIINDYSSGCGFMSNDLKEMLLFVLNVIKIAGPILAIALGMLDFVRAVVAGDADKELKAAGKRFLTRIIAAALLLLLPILLSFILNNFWIGKPNSDVFCNIVEWNK